MRKQKTAFVPTPFANGRARVSDFESELFLYICEQEDASQSETVRNAIRHYALTLGYLPDLYKDLEAIEDTLNDVRRELMAFNQELHDDGRYGWAVKVAEIAGMVFDCLEQIRRSEVE